MLTVGKRITDFANHHELLTVLRDALGGLQQLTVIGICHHNVSINNIVIGPTGYGVIIDLDYAVFIKDLQSNAKHHHRTGTGLFMAIHILLGDKVYMHSHDIESLFYVFIWICCYYGRTTVSHDRPNLDEWTRGSLHGIAMLKAGMMNAQLFETSVLAAFHPKFDDLKEFV
ncbi:hypothetical protein BC938DRAFT_482661 [Jimgerdemannia flammicorona]|uniref:Protein kinase domain-containing protein n=1 Tax=Jimgerdemannia flammicorona TaxID=994334 RepID=A0A433QDM8_9FUNG|nr:hypothetical protein BC938DRAFT_482661 [Jimgerdemannia flammicorona]